MRHTARHARGSNLGAAVALLVAALLVAVLLEAQLAGRVHPALAALWGWQQPASTTPEPKAVASQRESETAPGTSTPSSIAIPAPESAFAAVATKPKVDDPGAQSEAARIGFSAAFAAASGTNPIYPGMADLDAPILPPPPFAARQTPRLVDDSPRRVPISPIAAVSSPPFAGLDTAFVELREVRQFNREAVQDFFDNVQQCIARRAKDRDFKVARPDVWKALQEHVDKVLASPDEVFEGRAELMQAGLDLASIPLLMDVMRSDPMQKRAYTAAEVLAGLGPIAGFALVDELKSTSPVSQRHVVAATFGIADPWRPALVAGLRQSVARRKLFQETLDTWLDWHSDGVYYRNRTTGDVREMDLWPEDHRVALLELAAKRLATIAVANDSAARLKETIRVAAQLDPALTRQLTTSLIESVSNDSTQEHARIAISIAVEMDAQQADMLIAHLPSRFRADAVRWLAEVKPKVEANKIDSLLSVSLDDKSPAVRRAAAFEAAMLGLKARGATPQLMGLLDDEAPAVRREAAYALRVMLTASDAMLGIEEPARKRVPDLIAALADRDPDVVEAAAWSLEQLGPDAGDALPALHKRLETPDMHLRQRIKAAISAIEAK